ncbi:MalM family protein [Pseudomonas sp.]|uniref:MalM family protein n=1 Tax=Pseudomonas sp. TaxID=306 RepID=UPI003A9726A3
MDLHKPLLLFCTLCWALNSLAGARYLTWIDDQGRVHNTVMSEVFVQQQSRASKQVLISDHARFNEAGRSVAPPVPNESKRRYFTWVDGDGTLQNSFYADRPLLAGGTEVMLSTGELSSEYIDADVLEGRGYQRDGDDGQYYTWVDEQGRMQNSRVAPRISSGAVSGLATIEYTEGRQIEFSKKPILLPSLNGQRTTAMRELLSGSRQSQQGLYRELTDRCCTQMTDDDFTELSSDEPRFEELNRFSPSFDFPMGRSYYAAIKLPTVKTSYGLRVRSFANKQVVYPSLLFLDAQKRPTRLVSDAVYQLHAETWSRFAFIEGVVKIQAVTNESYVLLLTTEEDKALKTLDNKPFKRPFQEVVVDDAGIQARGHAGVGSFEIAVIR